MGSVGIAVVSHNAYYRVTLPRLFATLPTSLPVLVYINGSDYSEVESSDNKTFVHVSYNAFEYTALIEHAYTPRYTYIHVLHDTTEVGLSYAGKLDVYSLFMDIHNVDCIANNSNCGMWMYRTDALARHTEELASYRTITKQDAIQHEGWFRKYQKGSVHTIHDAIICDFIERDVYDTGSARITEYHPAFDVYKHKANYGQRGSGTFVQA